MSLPAPYQEHYYIADGVTTSFSFGEYFTAPASANVKCIVYFEDGTSSVPAFTVNIVTGFINITALTTPDGQVLNAPPAGSSVRVFRDTPEQQNVTASQIQNYTAKQLEKIFDSIVAMIQEVSYSDKHKTLRLTETQRDVFLSFLKEANDDALLYWDNESKTITPTDFVRQDIVRMSGGLFFRMKHDAKLRPYLEWSINGQTDWNSLNFFAQVDAAKEAKEIADEALTLAQSVQGDLSSHTTDLNNPHATSMGNLTDTDINAPTAGQFMKYDGSKWVNSDSSASVLFDSIEGNPYDNTALADALNNKADKSTTYTKTETDTLLGAKQDTISDLSTIRSNAQAGKSASNTIATYGNIVTHNVSEFATSAQGAKADTAVQPGDLATVATSGSYNDLSNKPTIPTVGNGTITIIQGGVNKGTFTTNQSGNTTIALDAGGGSIGNVDNLTITANANQEIQTVATINANTATGATNPIYDWVGTLAEYNAQNIETLHPDWICFITDDESGGASVYTKTEVDTIANGKVNVGHQVIAFQAPAPANNYTWYRKYADGWVEQGGRQSGTLSGKVFSITLPVPMANSAYYVSLLPSLGSQDTGNYYCRSIDSSTETQMKYFVYLNGSVTTNNPMVIWQVSGMAA